MSEEQRPQEERREDQIGSGQSGQEGAQPGYQTEAGASQPQHGESDAAAQAAEAARRAEEAASEARSAAQRAASEVGAAVRQRQAAGAPTVDPEANSDDRLMAALAYGTQLFIPVLVPIILLVSETSKVRPFQRYHAVQSLAFALTFFVFILALAIGTVFVQIIPILGQLIGAVVACFAPLLVLGWLALMVYYTVLAYQGKRFTIPGLTGWLQAQGWL